MNFIIGTSNNEFRKLNCIISEHEIKGILIDLWGTLLHDKSVSIKLFESRIEILERITKLHRIPVPSEGWVQRLKNERQVFRSEEISGIVQNQKQRLLRIIYGKSDDYDQHVLKEVNEEFNQIALRFIPPVNEPLTKWLEQLKSKEMNIALVSNTGLIRASTTRRILELLSLIDLFDSILLSEEVGFGKPNKLIFETAAISLSTTCSQVLHIGDDEELDIQAAQKAGCKALRIQF